MLLWLAYLTSPVPSKSKSAFRIVWFSRPFSIPSAVWSERTLQILYLALPLPLIIIGRRTSDTEPQLRQLADLLTKYISCSWFCSFSKAAIELVNLVLFLTLKVILLRSQNTEIEMREGVFKLSIENRDKTRKLLPDKSREIGSGHCHCYETSGRTRAKLKYIKHLSHLKISSSPSIP